MTSEVTYIIHLSSSNIYNLLLKLKQIILRKGIENKKLGSFDWRPEFFNLLADLL